jgi:3-hydroxyacyl-[acyl-carrier-protein] dehydratase
MNKEQILEFLPYSKPFLFVDELYEVDDEGAEGSFTFYSDMDCYKGHFKEYPVTPGVLLTECCAQIGLVCLGIYLLQGEKNLNKIKIGMSSSQMEFLKPVLPNETVRVVSKKIYFRFQKLKCEVRMYDAKGEMVCRGILAGMLTTNADE